jgi:hypothetical protein
LEGNIIGLRIAALAALLGLPPAAAEHDSPFIQMSFLKGDWIQVAQG